MVDPSEGTSDSQGGDGGPEVPAGATGGSSLPGTDTTAPCRQREQSPKLHLDLYNFDSPEADGSRYVLTSPRSLEACARCGVKPVELLPRSINEFVKEAPGHSMRVADGLFEIYERERLLKLKHCRDERERIVREEKRCPFNVVSSRVSTTLNGTSSSVSSSPASRTSSVNGTSDRASKPPSSGRVTSTAKPLAAGPPARRQTSHNGVTAAPSVKSSTSPVPDEKTGGDVSETKGKGKSHSLESLQKKHEVSTTTNHPSSESGASSSYSWGAPKAGSPQARTVATLNSLMGRSLSLGDLSHSPQTTKKVEKIVTEVKRRGMREVPERDRKIAALMLAKHQEEHINRQTRLVAHMQWDSERRLEEMRRGREEREKQRAILECQKMWHSQMSSRQQRLSQEQKDSATLRQRQASESEEHWKELAEKQERARQERLRQVALEEKQKKIHQEKNLRSIEEERQTMLEQEQQLLHEKLSMAELKRQEKEHQIQKERRGLNKAEKLRHKALLHEIARRQSEEKKLARRLMEQKLSRSTENYEQIQERRNQELKEKSKKEEQQIQKARKSAEIKEKEQRDYLEALAQRTEQRAQQAAQLAEEKAQQKALKVVQSRLEKEKILKLNRQKVEMEEHQRRQELLLSIEKKLEKSEQIFREKRAILESARSVARASFHVRDKVREETNVRTFDKMVLEAQLQASLDEK
ncbi:coiled-coil domain-containing protein 177 [Erpetoichthys calabaricus]|uniref:Coiled-coil domain containing 177 n=1 Tax=Erpetoichthys calabaricus TaxID=27687 RepID=A0A8C4SIH5_ERPCA|nr:coiled-coil domain-containing protein 177 [Erpetoichthys calabaricus]